MRAAVDAYLRDNPVDFAGAAYDNQHNYSLGDIVTSGSVIYFSLANDNAGNALTDTTHWVLYSSCLLYTSPSPRDS